MSLRARAVSLRQLPEALNTRQGQALFNDLETCMNMDRPCIVLDCSKVLQMDNSILHWLLCCLEEAMKRNGEVKLAGIPSGARALFGQSGVDRLFEIFETNEEAVNSFG
jgi:anti-anti-sigma regulatory factor